MDQRWLRTQARQGARRVRHWQHAVFDASPKLVIAIFHRILPRAAFNPLDTIMSRDAFVRQLDAIAQRYVVVSLEDAVTRPPPRRQTLVALTFDDGYWDGYEIVAPILRHKGWPATFLLPTRYIGSDGPPWDWEVVTRLIRHPQLTEVRIGAEWLRHRPSESRRAFALRVMDHLKAASLDTIEEVLHALRSQTADGGYAEDRCLTWDEVRHLADDGMTIGAHSVSHRSLARIPLHEALDELRTSKETIEAQIRQPCAHFAFPFGSRKDYSPQLIDRVKAFGFRTCLLNVHGYNRLSAGLFCLRRVIMTESTDPRCLLG